jgi:hypothetical protein
MDLKIPLVDVRIEIADRKKEITGPFHSDGYYNISQDEFTLDVENIASFYVSGGKYIEVFPFPGADESDINLYLNGSVFGAVLHQRKILPLHGSSFIYNGKGVLVCGDSGAGKSSVTASFCLDGSVFLTDDITPVIFNGSVPFIWTMSDRIKLWRDSLEQLKQSEEGLSRIYSETDKFYYHFDRGGNTASPLNLILILETHEARETELVNITGASMFPTVRNEIYRHEYLHGMPDNERIYFAAIVDICNTVKVGKILRPKEIKIEKLKADIARFISELSL